ncbi:MAG: hypothetical protein ACAI35_26595 [Candidatus Methylacidiphilales bacterium]|nr:hypothetical protein [Candidatus Methylacidiphilales bacterium]
MKTLFIKPRLSGSRFDEHSLPLEVLKDWAAFEELVLEVARSVYLQNNPTRKQVPRGFAEGFSLHLSGVEAGSAVPVIDRLIPDGMLPFADDIFAVARNLVLLTISAVTIGQPIPVEFPRELLGYFDKFGKSLRANESVELSAPGQAVPVLYDKAVRKKLVLLGGAREYRATAELRGWVSEVNVEKQSYILKLVNGDRLPGQFAPEIRKTVVAALDEYEESKVLVRGIVIYDQGDRPRKIEQTAHIELLDANDVPGRLDELALIKDGWLEGGGTAPSREGMNWLAEEWTGSYPGDLPNPFVYPTPEGNVQLEWTLGQWEVAAEIDFKTRRAFLFAVHTETEETHDGETDLRAAAGWESLALFVRNHLTA